MIHGLDAICVWVYLGVLFCIFYVISYVLTDNINQSINFFPVLRLLMRIMDNFVNVAVECDDKWLLFH